MVLTRSSGVGRRVATALAGCGWIRLPGFMPESTVRLLRREARALLDLDGAEAGIGRGARLHVDKGVRGDRICWLSEDGALTPALTLWRTRILELMAELRRELFVPLAELEAFVACYPPGAGYARHRDRFRDDDARVISCTTYLNPDWRPGDGGELRLWECGDGRVVDVAPRAGTACIFRSEDIDHAVLPTHAARYSVTGWMRVARRP